MKKKSLIVFNTLLCIILSACSTSNNGSQDSTSVHSEVTTTETSQITILGTIQNTTQTTKEVKTYSPVLLQEELDSIVIGKLSPEHIYYEEVVTLDPECAEYINEISIYDKEIDDTFIIHVSLPPNYDSSKQYPMIVMTDGVWRLSDHPELRPLMKNGEVEDIIMVSVGYPNDYDYRTIRERDLVKDPESYLHFIVDNLVPYLSEQYSVDSEDMTLTGHSYGGYWAYYALFNSDTIGKNTFKNYYIGSPSFQATTNLKDIYDYEEEYYSRNKTIDCNVYVTVGSEEDTSFIREIEKFNNFLSTRNYEGLNFKYEVIDGYNHDTVFKPSIKNTLLMYYGKE